jgi:hypothetical protein
MVPNSLGISLLDCKKGINMAYIRVKKIGKKNRYAYLVENKWKKRVRKGSKKGARQKVKGYLGKVHEFSRIGEREFLSHFNVKDIKIHFDENGIGKIVKDLVRVELMNHGFEETGDFYANGDLAVYISNKDFFIKNLKEEKDRKLVIGMNEGFLCKETFNKLINFKAKGDEKEVGLQLGNTLLEAGLKVPQEIFVEMFVRFING